jgi:hypothetical protein
LTIFSNTICFHIQAEIPIPNNFCKNWNAEIVKHHYGWICGETYAIMVIFHLSDSPKYLSSGCQVAKSLVLLNQPE